MPLHDAQPGYSAARTIAACACSALIEGSWIRARAQIQEMWGSFTLRRRCWMRQAWRCCVDEGRSIYLPLLRDAKARSEWPNRELNSD